MNRPTLWMEPVPEAQTIESLTHRVAKLERINAALMAHVERTMDQQGGAYSLFQTAIMLEGRVRARTEELTALMNSLERSNAAMQAAKEEAETANRSKTRFLAAASHDLLQPLNAARLSLSALTDLAPGPEAQGIARQVERGLETIEDLIKALIDISKLDAGIVRPVVKPVRLADLVAGIEASFRPFAERKELRLVTRCADLVVETDGILLQRILQNLVSNAIRYTESGGVLIAARRRDRLCRIDVVDTGCGIPETERALVFEEFFRGARECDDGGIGLGLGLSIVQRMASTLDHAIELHSRSGHGTRLSLTLPLATQRPDARVTLAPLATALTGARVLAIENDASTAEALQRLLRNWDAEVQVFRDLAGVVAALGAGLARPDVMVIDYHLDNGACGLDVVDYLRRNRGWVTPVILTTADHGADIAARAQATGAELVHKPIKPAQLRSLLAYMLA
ncbi:MULTISPECIES: ATP-binding response regulator [Methylorubrum]|uniref:ATP-binding response regulator n=1 Tax=Methylorubrum TaxID=2282523 RepID=UPI0020A01DBC|nr:MULTISPECIES: hybrid sensor histidine kinase/response regulator [Methylorubrum]MCP1547810.1 signal transduction histidine kinase/CheY-like chemotaxis protein [Methylorubrum zatmanii]MCP1555574.1 signal transduction histidine kinase/CheY-like chemotaxis protein [Methylorubrum extorquens]MCP1578113.1 signal transduction histidine kinase/CheY-like chemotaxis protein [Methylorubrum extorquens]